MKSKIMKMMVAALALSSFGLMGCEEKEAAYSDKPENITVKDADGNEYPTVKIGQQIWMAKNLNVNVLGSMCYAAGCEKYGRLYTWKAAMKACPTGWHLPSKEEFDSFLAAVGFSSEYRSENLRAGSWENGKDKYGFSALPAGEYNSILEELLSFGSSTLFWSSTETNSRGAYYLYINVNDAGVHYNGKGYGFSVRCLQD